MKNLFFKGLIVAVCLLVNVPIALGSYKDDMLLNGFIESNVEMITLAVQNGATDLNYNRDGITPLTASINRGNIDLIKFLLKNGVDVNLQNPYRYDQTPLIFALSQYSININIVKELIDGGADVNLANRDGMTPLMVATAKLDGYGAVKLLLEKGADPNKATLKGNTPLMNTSYLTLSAVPASTKLAMAKLLLTAGADPAMTNNDAKTALNLAVDSRFNEMIKLLLSVSQKI